MARADCGSSVPSVHFRHLEVHEHEVELGVAKRIESLTSVRDERRVTSTVAQDRIQENTIGGTVIRNEGPQRAMECRLHSSFT